MTPDEIKLFIEANYADILTDDRNNPDGWSFFYGEIRKGPKSTRVARAVEGRSGKANEFKLSVTSRLEKPEAVVEITNERQLRELFDEELRLLRQNFVSAGT